MELGAARGHNVLMPQLDLAKESPGSGPLYKT
jgi:hypothetical protein